MSTIIGHRSKPVSSAMAEVMVTDLNATAPIPAGVTPGKIDENRPPLAGPNRPYYDSRWDHLVNHFVPRPKEVVPACNDRNNPKLQTRSTCIFCIVIANDVSII